MSNGEIVSVLPGHSSGLERVLEATSLWVIENSPIPATWDPDQCPASLLPFLFWSMSGDNWDPEWSDDTKRASIRASIGVHKTKGTLGAVKDALRAAGYGDAQIIENYGATTRDGSFNFDGSETREPSKHWAEYRLVLTRPITVEQADQVREILAEVAPKRAHLEGMDYVQAAHLYNNTIPRDGTNTRGVV